MHNCGVEGKRCTLFTHTLQNHHLLKLKMHFFRLMFLLAYNFHLCKIAQAQSDWMESVCELQFLVWDLTDPFYHVNTLRSKPVCCSSACMFSFVVFLKGNPQPPCHVFSGLNRVVFLRCPVFSSLMHETIPAALCCHHHVYLMFMCSVSFFPHMAFGI
ncbi:hypothetical protein ILYODFUR_031034 [Ilyodon furcidens]|uniref:Uncharacterized protein n=1 Tax=Ilyodon furcidens TaxID=33524 RepID=A0ABV0ULL1_9TELE